MNETIITGGSAFPESPEATSGMTLRDYFAAKALPGLVERAMIEEWMRGGPEWRDAVAIEAYTFADAMLKAREAK